MSVHAELILCAAAWLKARRCSVVITDMTSGAGETPDAIGFNSFQSILIECKASRADFHRDADKHTRRTEGAGMGNHRFYMAPEGMLKVVDLPIGWGLLEVNAQGKVRMRADSKTRECDKRNELCLMVSAVRRIGQNPPPGISVKCYTLETERRATIGIEPETTPDQESP